MKRANSHTTTPTSALHHFATNLWHEQSQLHGQGNCKGQHHCPHKQHHSPMRCKRTIHACCHWPFSPTIHSPTWHLLQQSTTRQRHDETDHGWQQCTHNYQINRPRHCGHYPFQIQKRSRSPQPKNEHHQKNQNWNTHRGKGQGRWPKLRNQATIGPKKGTTEAIASIIGSDITDHILKHSDSSPKGVNNTTSMTSFKQLQQPSNVPPKKKWLRSKSVCSH